MTSESPGADARHRRARRPRRGAGHLRAVGGAGHGHRQGHRRRGPAATAGGRLRILDGFDGEVLADVPAASLHEDAPLYDRPRAVPAGFDEATRTLARRRPARLRPTPAPTSWRCCADTVVGVVAVRPPAVPQHGRGARRRRHGAAPQAPDDRRRHGSGPGADDRRQPPLVRGRPAGRARAHVAESVLNLACVGARPIAVVNCLNFGNPEHPEVMWQLSEAIDGMSDACRGLRPAGRRRQRQPLQRVAGADIDPTPVIGLLGRGRRPRSPPARASNFVEGGRLVLLGVTQRELSGSTWARDQGHRGGRLPALDLAMHLQVAEVVR